MSFFKQLSIQNKLVTIMLFLTGFILFVGFSLVVFIDINKSKQDMLNNSLTNARMIAEYSVSPMIFSDKKGAENILSRINSLPAIRNAHIYDLDGNLFASYDKISISSPPTLHASINEGIHFENQWLHVFQPIIHKNQSYGSIYLRASTEGLTKKTINYIYTLSLLLLALIFLAFFFARYLQKIISQPITQLVEVASQAKDKEEDNFRIKKTGEDEINFLNDTFKKMMDKIYLRRQERDNALVELHKEKKWAQVTLKSIADGVITTDTAGSVHYLNTTAERLTGWTLKEAENQLLDEIFFTIDEKSRHPLETPVSQCLREKKTIEPIENKILICRDDREIAIEDSASPIFNQNNKIIGVVLVFHDETKSRKLSQQLSYLARHDTLTNLINRHEFEIRLKRAINQAYNHHCQHALLYMDLDQFKVINDTCGHSAGDELLRQVTALLQSMMRQRDTLARLGGDEFGVLLEHCDTSEAKLIAEKLCQAVSDYHFIWNESRFTVGVSIGLISINQTSGSLENVLSLADNACYAAKDSGRNRVHNLEDDGAAVHKRHGEMKWVSRINQGLEKNQFVLFRQKIECNIHSNAPETHYEILLRMLDDNGAIVLPGAFIPAAERYNLMPKIDRWVIKTALTWLKNNLSTLSNTGMYSINLSGCSIGDPNFFNFITDQLNQTNIPPHKVCFEITETATIVNLTQATQFIRSLKKIGCRFALDDFGSGMSSFLYLKNLPVDFLKIDGGFIKDITHDAMDYALVKSINDIGHVMGMKTIAECVENESVHNKLKEIGVDFVQGFHMGKPTALKKPHHQENEKLAALIE